MGAYAAETSVPVEKSRMEIERTLQRYGAEAFAYSTDGPRAMIMFRLKGRYVRFHLLLPDQDLPAFTHHSRGRRTPAAAREAWEQACRQKWRALALVIKAKLEAVSAGITTVEDEFLSHTLLPDGTAFGDWAKPEVEKAYATGEMPTGLLLEAPR